MKPSRQWLLAVAPAVGVAAIVVPGLGAHASNPGGDGGCTEAPATSTSVVNGAHDEQVAHESDDDGSRLGRRTCMGGDDDPGRSRHEGDDDDQAGLTSTTARSPAGDPTSTTVSTTTTSSTSSTSTSTTSTSTTIVQPSSPITVGEQFTQLANGKPMLVALTVTNTSAQSHTLDVTVEVKGSAEPPPYLNVNSDSTQTLLANWSCTPGEMQHPTTDNTFTCGVVIPASTANVVMVTTGSNFRSSGASLTVVTTVTQLDGVSSNLPQPVAVTGTVA